MQLSFGEQVKIVLKRQGITIKELASIIEQQTGKKMSRQNLTQRLGRDNFQEKDMFMIAEALGCSLTINLLDAEEPAVVRETPAPAAAPEPVVEEKAAPEPAAEEAASAEEPAAEPVKEAEPVAAAAEESTPEPEISEPAPEPEPSEEDEFVEEELIEEELIEEPFEEPEEEPAQATAELPKVPEGELSEKKNKFRPLSWYKRGSRKAEEETAEETAAPEAEQTAVPEEPAEEPAPERELTHEELMKELNADIAALGDAETLNIDDIPDRGFDRNPENEHAFEREKMALLNAQEADRNAELPADQLPSTSVNPYTLREYKSNTVRAHATRIGYVQVYSRIDHAWRDMTEWAFMGEQERKKTLLGDQYEEPTYLD